MGGGWFVGEGLGACDTASSEAEESVVYRVEVMKEKDDVELLPRARRGSASGSSRPGRWRWEYTASSYGMA